MLSGKVPERAAFPGGLYIFSEDVKSIPKVFIYFKEEITCLNVKKSQL
jgi:hypothetical protein